MKFQLAINLERMDDSLDRKDVASHTLQMVQMADQGGFNIVWAAEHHALEMTIAPNPFSILTWWAGQTDRIRLGTAVAVAAHWHPIKLAGVAAFLDLVSGGRLEFCIGSGAISANLTACTPVSNNLMRGATCRKCCQWCRSFGRAITNTMESSGPSPNPPRSPNPCRDMPHLGRRPRANHL